MFFIGMCSSYICENIQSIFLLDNTDIGMFVTLKIAFNTRELYHPNDSNGSAEASDESSAGRSCCKEKIETQRYAISEIIFDNFDNFLHRTNFYHVYKNVYLFVKDNASAHQENNETLELDLLGEGEESGELMPGKSLVFAVLEVCLCLLVRQIPALNPNPDGATAILSQKGYASSEKSGKLIASSLSIMESLPTLCSPQGIFIKPLCN